MLSRLLNRAHQRLLPPSAALPLPHFLSSSSSSSSPPLPPLPPPACSPARLRKLVAAEPDPLLAKSIFDLAASLRPVHFSPSSPASYPALHVLLLKLVRARRFSLADSLLRRLPSPSPGLFASLIQAYSEAGQPHRAVAVFRHMLLHTSCKPRPKHLNRVLSALAARPAHLRAALELLRSADALGAPASVRSYNILIRAFCRSGTLSIAYHLFNKMLEKGFAPDVETYRVLMQGLCRKSQVNTAVDLLEDMLNKGYVPDAFSYTTLLNSLCRKKKLREAYKLLCRMKVKGCNPDIVHYNTVVLGFCREGRPLDACKMLEDMPDNGCLPNIVTYTTIVNGLCSKGLVEEGNRYMVEMVSKGLVPHFSLFHVLVKGLCSVGKFEEACGVLGEMLSRGVSPHVDTWVMVLSGVCEDDGEKSVEDVKKVVMEEEWKRCTRILQAGCKLEEYMVRKFRGRRMQRSGNLEEQVKESFSPAMNRARSSFDQKPPLAVSPRRLRPRRGLRSDAVAPRTPPAPSPQEAPQLRRSCAPDESPLLEEYERISRELKALAKRGKDDFADIDALQTIAFATNAAIGNTCPLFERGRLYEVYSARRNERLKRKMEETAEEESPARRSAADAKAGKRRSTRRMDSVRKSAPENFLVVGRAPTLRSSLRSSTVENKTAHSVLRSAVKYNAEGEGRPSASTGRKK